MSKYTLAEKAECAKREVAQRRRVYANLVRSGRMTQTRADKEIAMMEEVEGDYRALIKLETVTPPIQKELSL